MDPMLRSIRHQAERDLTEIADGGRLFVRHNPERGKQARHLRRIENGIASNRGLLSGVAVKRLQNDNSTWPERTGHRLLHLAPADIGQQYHSPSLFPQRSGRT